MFLLKIKNNQIVFPTKEAENSFSKLLSNYNNTGKTLILEIHEYSKKVNDKQLGLFTAIVIAGKEHTGMSYSEFENSLITELAPYNYITDIFGNKIKERIKPHEMNTKQFSFFIEECVRFMNDFFEMDFKLY